jgi:polyferredoxin
MLALFFFLVLGEPVAMVTFGGFVQGVTLPVISLAAVYLRYRRLDRRIAPSPLTDGLFLFAAIAMSLFALYAAYDFLSKTFGTA